VSSFAQNLLNALSLGALTALVALGLAMVFSIMNLINFAHGAIITLGGFAMLYGAKAGLPFALIVPLTVAVTTLAAVLMERIAFRPLRGASPLSLLLSSFAINALLQVVYQVVVSPRPRPVTLPGFLSSTVRVGSLDISVVDLCSIGASALALLVLTTFLRRSVLGIAMRAAAEDFPVTRLMGIRANRVVAGAFAASGALAGLASVLLVAQRGSVDPTMGLQPLFAAFAAAIIGGLGSLPGAAIAGLLFGAAQALLQAYLPAGASDFRDPLVWTAVIAVLLLRPHGLLATRSLSGAKV
jgi:branched-chain amino acid transport system permease protein